jgi:hypothetical protein
MDIYAPMMSLFWSMRHSPCGSIGIGIGISSGPRKEKNGGYELRNSEETGVAKGGIRCKRLPLCILGRDGCVIIARETARILSTGRIVAMSRKRDGCRALNRAGRAREFVRRS